VSGVDFRALARTAAARYPPRERFVRHWAYGKLTGDPVYRQLLDDDLIPRNARLLDLGCGQGLIAVLLAATRADEGYRYRGIDLSARDIERARAAGRPTDQFAVGDIRAVDYGRADVIVILDVLHYLDPDAQLGVLRGAADALSRDGTLLLRVADASGGLRFRVTEAVDLVVTRLRGHAVKRLHNHPLDERVRQLESLGLAVEARPMSAGTPFANVLLVARYDSRTHEADLPLRLHDDELPRSGA
jgi:SAM-dependent methyltransferase